MILQVVDYNKAIFEKVDKTIIILVKDRVILCKFPYFPIYILFALSKKYSQFPMKKIVTQFL